MNELNSLVAAAAPLVFAVVGETITEKAGIINLSLEGSLMLSAMTGFAVSYETNSLILGFLAAAVVSSLVALLVAYSSIALKLNQVAVGFVLFQLCTDLSTFLGNSYVRIPGPSVGALPIPLLEDIPILGRILFDQDLVVYASFLVVIAAYYFIFRTRQGLDLQGIGERPEAAHARGVPVNRLRYMYAALGGSLVGIAGASYSLAVKLGWSFQHTRNLGWIALAIVIFGGWQPVRAAAGAYLFAGLLTLAQILQEPLPGIAQVLPTIPFPLMILTLVIVYSDWLQRLTDRFPALRSILGSEPPTAIGTVFEPE
jgi:simple sugar transport system permease protein